MIAAPAAEEIARDIREQGLQKPAVVGHSMGGTIAMMLAARHPDSVGRLMVVSSAVSGGLNLTYKPQTFYGDLDAFLSAK